MAELFAKDDLKIRVSTLKRRFKTRPDYTSLYEYEFGALTKEEKAKIRDVWNLRIADEAITKNLERIAKKVKA
jgi:hypothetical protein